MNLNTLIDYLEQLRQEHGGNITVVLTEDDVQEPMEFIALSQIPGLSDSGA